jgi:hypothetical protein
MKLIALAIVTMLGLAGCAAQSPTRLGSMEPDYAQMQAISNAARAQGVQIIWFHPPLKAVKPASN